MHLRLESAWQGNLQRMFHGKQLRDVFKVLSLKLAACTGDEWARMITGKELYFSLNSHPPSCGKWMRSHSVLYGATGISFPLHHRLHTCPENSPWRMDLCSAPASQSRLGRGAQLPNTCTLAPSSRANSVQTYTAALLKRAPVRRRVEWTCLVPIHGKQGFQKARAQKQN